MQKLIDRLDNFSKLSPKKVVFVSLFSAVVMASAGAFVVPKIYADTLQDQIEQLTAEARQDQSAVDGLLVEAKSYEDAINSLQAQIAVLEQNITVNQARQEDLQKQISAKQKELDAQRDILGDDIKAMYVDGQLSTIEMLATSKDLNDFVDSATYREAVQRKIQKTLEEIAKLQNQLQGQKLEVDKLLAAQRVQQEPVSDRSRPPE
jgi:peptidoglycan hydrolase CwlO-like protein